jgi:hypothetical protein
VNNHDHLRTSSDARCARKQATIIPIFNNAVLVAEIKPITGDKAEY